MHRNTGLALVAMTALTLGTAGESAAQVPITSTPEIKTWGHDIFVKFIGSSAALRSELWFFGDTNPGPDQTPLWGSSTYPGSFLFSNKNPQTSMAEGSGGVAAVGSEGGNLNTLSLLGAPFAKDEVLNFGFFVKDLYKEGTTNPIALTEGLSTRNAWLYAGSGASNMDGRIHTKVTEIGQYRYRVGFEDLCKDPKNAGSDVCANTQYGADWDYDDHVFEVSSNPEPVSMALMGTGLMGLAGAARRRRRREQGEG